MTVLLALVAALSYGISDFSGGLASRRIPVLTVLLLEYPVGAALMAALLPVFPGHVGPRVVVFGVLGGLSGMLALISFYRALAAAPMSVVSPVAAVLSAAVPVAVGVATGDRPSTLAWIGVVVGVGAVVLVSRSPTDEVLGAVTARTVALAVLAGIGFGAYFVFLGRAGDHSGVWPLVISRVTSAVLIVPIGLLARTPRRIAPRMLPLVLLAGALDAGANLFFLLATRHGLLSLASVITSLYPAATVALAAGILRERTGPAQRVGLGLAAAAIVLITV